MALGAYISVRPTVAFNVQVPLKWGLLLCFLHQFLVFRVLCGLDIKLLSHLKVDLNHVTQLRCE